MDDNQEKMFFARNSMKLIFMVFKLFRDKSCALSFVIHICIVLVILMKKSIFELFFSKMQFKEIFQNDF